MIEAENNLVSIGYELAAQAIHIGFAGLPLVGRSLLLGYCGDREEQQAYQDQARRDFHLAFPKGDAKRNAKTHLAAGSAECLPALQASFNF